MVAEQFLNSSPGLKEQWDQAECDEDIKRCLDKMFPALLQLLHGNECGTSRPTYYGTHGGAPSAHAHICRNFSASLVSCSTPHDRFHCSAVRLCMMLTLMMMPFCREGLVWKVCGY